MQKDSFLWVCCLLAGCASYGPSPILTAKGPVLDNHKPDYIGRFARSAAAASGEMRVPPATETRDTDAAQKAGITIGNEPTWTKTAVTLDLLNAMLEDGFVLVYANCSDFFRDSGQRQTRLMVWRDAITTAGTLIAGALAVDGGGHDDALAVVTLGTAGAMSGIDAYTQRYLFGAENVDSVRELTLRALSAHAGAVKTDSPPTTYQQVTIHLLDHQAICTPPRIAMLARDAIKEGRVVAHGPDDSLEELDQVRDRAVLKRLGAELNPPGALSLSEAGAYYWLFFGEPPATTPEMKMHIQPTLVAIPTAKNPFEGTELKPVIPHQAIIESELMRLTLATRANFEGAIKLARQTPPVVVEGAGFMERSPLVVQPLPERSSGGRVEIRVE